MLTNNPDRSQPIFIATNIAKGDAYSFDIVGFAARVRYMAVGWGIPGGCMSEQGVMS